MILIKIIKTSITVPSYNKEIFALVNSIDDIEIAKIADNDAYFRNGGYTIEVEEIKDKDMILSYLTLELTNLYKKYKPLENKFDDLYGHIKHMYSDFDIDSFIREVKI